MNLEKKTKKTSGLDAAAGVPTEGDGQYIKSLGSGVGKTTSKPATQAKYLFAENRTSDKQIISADVYQKNCTCPGASKDIHHAPCTANLPPDAVIGNEGLYLSNAVDNIAAKGVPVATVTTDGDSSALHTTKAKGVIQYKRTVDVTMNSAKHIKN